MDETLAGIVSRLENTHTCLHPTIVGRTIPSTALHTLASAMLQIHNNTTDTGTQQKALQSLLAIEDIAT